MAISKAVKSGLLVRGPEGIDLDDPHTVSYLRIPSEQRHRASGKTKGLKKHKPRTSPRRRQNVTQIKADTVNINPPSEPDSPTIADIKDQLAIEDLIKKRLANQITRNELIDRLAEEDFLKRFYGVIISAFRNLSSRTIPEIIAKARAAENPVVAEAEGSKVLDDEVYKGFEYIVSTMHTHKKELPSLAEIEVPTRDSVGRAVAGQESGPVPAASSGAVNI